MRVVKILLLPILILFGILFTLFSNNIGKEGVIYIDKNINYNLLLNYLSDSNYIKNIYTFDIVSKLKRYPQNIKEGRYLIQKGMSNLDLINMLIIGRQKEVDFSFNNIRDLKGLSEIIDKQLKMTSKEFIETLKDSINSNDFDFNKNNILGMFIPNTYHVYWNIKPSSFIRRMHREYNNFWGEERLLKSRKLGLKPIEVITLASIIEEETSKKSEYPIIAGVYLNRLKKGMKLEADPTLKFSAGDFSIKRLRNIHKAINSPYNTYLNYGLPPGPIRIASINTIDAVLNPSSHDYLYFCANSDFSGTHIFTKTYNQHLRNARKYHSELRKRKIFK